MGRVAFTKMHGAGNDYVYVDATHDAALLARLPSFAAAWSDRHFGIGADGLIAIGPSARGDVRMHMWNADGSRGALCVNGLRCVARFAHDRGVVATEAFAVETDVGVHQVELLGAARDAVRVLIENIRVADHPEHVTIAGQSWTFVEGSAGNPHAVVLLAEDPESVDVVGIGMAFQRLPRFESSGVNVEFVRADPPDGIVQRTFERGSGETLACGSGSIVAACAAITHLGLPGPRVRVRLRGGTLEVTRRGSDKEFELVGPVAVVFEGVVSVPSEPAAGS